MGMMSALGGATAGCRGWQPVKLPTMMAARERRRRPDLTIFKADLRV
jgi:hypothetical protein